MCIELKVEILHILKYNKSIKRSEMKQFIESLGCSTILLFRTYIYLKRDSYMTCWMSGRLVSAEGRR